MTSNWWPNDNWPIDEDWPDDDPMTQRTDPMTDPVDPTQWWMTILADKPDGPSPDSDDRKNPDPVGIDPARPNGPSEPSQWPADWCDLTQMTQPDWPSGQAIDCWLVNCGPNWTVIVGIGPIYLLLLTDPIVIVNCWLTVIVDPVGQLLTQWRYWQPDPDPDPVIDPVVIGYYCWDQLSPANDRRTAQPDSRTQAILTRTAHWAMADIIERTVTSGPDRPRLTDGRLLTARTRTAQPGGRWWWKTQGLNPDRLLLLIIGHCYWLLLVLDSEPGSDSPIIDVGGPSYWTDCYWTYWLTDLLNPVLLVGDPVVISGQIIIGQTDYWPGIDRPSWRRTKPDGRIVGRWRWQTQTDEPSGGQLWRAQTILKDPDGVTQWRRWPSDWPSWTDGGQPSPDIEPNDLVIIVVIVLIIIDDPIIIDWANDGHWASWWRTASWQWPIVGSELLWTIVMTRQLFIGQLWCYWWPN